MMCANNLQDGVQRQHANCALYHARFLYRVAQRGALDARVGVMPEGPYWGLIYVPLIRCMKKHLPQQDHHEDDDEDDPRVKRR